MRLAVSRTLGGHIWKGEGEIEAGDEPEDGEDAGHLPDGPDLGPDDLFSGLRGAPCNRRS